MQGGRGQCERQALLWAEKSAAAGIYCRASRVGTDAGKPGFIGFFVLARRLLKYMHELSAATARCLLEFCHVPCFGRCVVGHRCPQGADVVEVVVRAIHRRQPERQEPVRSIVLEFVRLRSARAPGSGGGCSQISPETMSALLDAQSQSSTGSATTASKSRSSALKDLFGADRWRRRRQDHQVGIRRRARRRRHQPDEGRQRVRQARQGRRRLGQPQGAGVGAEGRQETSP